MLKGRRGSAFYSLFQSRHFKADNASDCFPPCESGGARQRASARWRWAGLKCSALKAKMQSGSQTYCMCTCVKKQHFLSVRCCVSRPRTHTQLGRGTHGTKETGFVPPLARLVGFTLPEEEGCSFMPGLLFCVLCIIIFTRLRGFPSWFFRFLPQSKPWVNNTVPAGYQVTPKDHSSSVTSIQPC